VGQFLLRPELFPVVALAGYTNAGKSTLFNTLTKSEVLAKDLLFATLDPTMRGIKLPSGRRIVVSENQNKRFTLSRPGIIASKSTETMFSYRGSTGLNALC
jgi:GTPase involved in cell partitioning and DNA repair